MESLKTYVKQVIIFSTILFFALGIGYLNAAWSGPPAGTPPDNNVEAPINVGTSDQVKNAGLGVNSLAVFGDAYLTGEILSPSGIRKWTSTSTNGNFRMTQQDGGGRYNMAWNVEGSGINNGTYAKNDLALWMKWSTNGWTFYSAPAGTAGDPITWTSGLRQDENGNVGVGNAALSAGLKLDVEGKVGATEYCDQNGNNCTPAADLVGGGGGGVTFTLYGAQDRNCNQWIQDLDQITGNTSGYTNVGSSAIFVANDGSRLFKATILGDCSPMTNVPRAYAIVPKDSNGNIVRNYWDVGTLPPVGNGGG